MTRIAVLADVHGNAVALERVLDDLGRIAPDRMVCLGDVAATGAQPRQVVARLRGLQCAFVRGNADAYLLDPRPLGDDEFTRRIEDIDRWCSDQLTGEDLDFLATFRDTVRVELPTGSLLAYHGSPTSYDDSIGASTPDEELQRLLGGRRAAVFAGGHTHFAFARRFGESYVINPGSVGLAYDRSRPLEAIKIAPWAEYAVLEAVHDRLGIELRRIEFDLDAYLDVLLSSGMPHAQWMAGEYRRP